MTRLHTLRNGLADIVRRFPVPVACSVIFTLLACWSVWIDNRYDGSARLASIHTILFVGCFWFIGLRLTWENRPELPRSFRMGYCAAYALIAVYLYVSRDVTFYGYIFLCLGVFLVMFIAPYKRGGSADNDVAWNFAYRLVLRIAFTFLAALVLYLGAIAIVASMQFLFDMKYSAGLAKIYFYIWIVVAALFSPLFAMGGIPKSFAESEEAYPKFLRILLCNLIIPLWCCYALVVYAYIAKILFERAMPQGNVAILISVFAVKGMAIYLASYPLYQRRQTIAWWFGRHWMKLLIAPLVLLAVAIGERIHAYGLTQDRYAIVLCLLWLLIAMAERLRNEAQAPRRILIWAVGLLFGTSIGPGGIDNFSTESQMWILESVLKNNQMLANGKLIPPPQPVSFKDRATISSIADYLVEFDRLDEIKPWFAEKFRTEMDARKHEDAENYEMPAQIVVEDMGLKYVTRWEKENNEVNNSDVFNYNEGVRKKALKVGGYDYYATTTNFAQMCSLDGAKITLDRVENATPLVFSIALNPATSQLTLVNDATHRSLSFNLEKLIKKSEWHKIKESLPDIEGENSEIKVRMSITNICGKFEGEKPVISSLTTTLLIKLK